MTPKKHAAFKPPVPADTKLNTKKEKIPNEWGLINFGRRIIEVNSANDSTTNIYTVPQGKIFYLINAEIAALSNAVSGGCWIENQDNDRIIEVRTSAAADQQINESSTFTIPIKFISGEIIRIESNASGVSAEGIIVGYEIDAVLVPNFI